MDIQSLKLKGWKKIFQKKAGVAILISDKLDFKPKTATRDKEMEKYTMFLDWNNQYCENDCTTQSNLQIQCNPYQITNGLLHRIRSKNFTICIETQKTLNSQSNLEKEKWSRGNQAP